jgi:hypothetical protein
MIRSCRWLAPLALLGALYTPAPLAGQFDIHIGLEPLTTRTLYILGRQKAERINKECSGDLDVYLDGVAFLYAYQQAANKDGSLQRDPQFAQVFGQQFTEVVERARRCLKAYAQNASSAARIDGSPSARSAVDPGVVLPNTPPPEPPSTPVPTPTPAAATDAQGRTIPQLVAIIEAFPQERGMYRQEITRVEQQRDALVAEVTRLRNLAAVPAAPPPPPPLPPPTAARTGVEYQVRVKASNRYWFFAPGGGTNLLSTRALASDEYARFTIESSGDGGWRIRNRGTGRYLYVSSNYQIGSVAVANDDDSVFLMFLQPDGSYRIQARARGRYLLEERGDPSWPGLVTALAQPDDDFTRFFFVP